MYETRKARRSPGCILLFVGATLLLVSLLSFRSMGTSEDSAAWVPTAYFQESHQALLARHDAEALRDFASYSPSEDPLPGVDMVYMYVNGSDPRVAGPRAALGGTVSGAVRFFLHQPFCAHARLSNITSFCT